MTDNDDQEGTEPQIPNAGGDPEPPTPPLAPQPTAISAHTFVRDWPSSSHPLALKCDDGRVYVVKARQHGQPSISRMMIAEHVVGRLGQLLAAPVPEVAFIEVPAALVSAQPEMRNFVPGIAHGSRFVDGATDAQAMAHVAEPENRARFARLAVLFGWTHAADHQFIYQKTPPPRVYSHDHGHFFPGGPNWSEASLSQQRNAILDTAIVQGCSLNAAEIAEAIARLNAISLADLEAVVTEVPADWGITDAERTALLPFLTERRAALLTQHPPAPH